MLLRFVLTTGSRARFSRVVAPPTAATTLRLNVVPVNRELQSSSAPPFDQEEFTNAFLKAVDMVPSATDPYTSSQVAVAPPLLPLD